MFEFRNGSLHAESVPLEPTWHEIVPLRNSGGTGAVYVVGPVCESADFFGKERPEALFALEHLLR